MKFLHTFGIAVIILVSGHAHAKPLDDKYGPAWAEFMRCVYQVMVDENVEHALPTLWDDPAADDIGLKDHFALLRALQKSEKTCKPPAEKLDPEPEDDEFWADAKADHESQ